MAVAGTAVKNRPQPGSESLHHIPPHNEYPRAKLVLATTILAASACHPFGDEAEDAVKKDQETRDRRPNCGHLQPPAGKGVETPWLLQACAGTGRKTTGLRADCTGEAPVNGAS